MQMLWEYGCHSLTKGCLSTRGERILFLDADGATKIADIERLEKAMDDLTTDPVGHTSQVLQIWYCFNDCVSCHLPLLLDQGPTCNKRLSLR